MMTLPAHKCGLYLEHNVYRDYHDPIEKAVVDEDEHQSWISPDERAASLRTGELWTLQWYPNTPAGFYRVAGASLESVLAAANKAQ